MSVCKKHLNNPELRKKVVSLYRESLSTAEQVAENLNITPHTTYRILRLELGEEEFKKLKAIKYSSSKLGEKNPWKGKRGEEAATWKGDCDDGYGYLTRLIDGQRYFVHRIVMAEALGIHPSQLPDHLAVHHIDQDRKNNALDNLALCTTSGHRGIHERYKHTDQELKLKGLSLAEAIQYMTSP